PPPPCPPGSPQSDVTVPGLFKPAATGGTEKSWYRCVFPFGVISLVIGVAGTGVTFMYNTPDLHQTKVVSMVLLVMGLLMLTTAAICWRVHRLKRRKKKEGGFFCSEQGTLVGVALERFLFL
uniref:Transmembrane protein 100 n=1 Tax=Esox lucius TaxID=8010 RepID=A0A3P8YRY5_ESOLU